MNIDGVIIGTRFRRILDTIKIEIKKIENVLTCCQNWARISGPCDLVVNQSKDSIGLQRSSHNMIAGSACALITRVVVHNLAVILFFFLIDLVFSRGGLVIKDALECGWIGRHFGCWPSTVRQDKALHI